MTTGGATDATLTPPRRRAVALAVWSGIIVLVLVSALVYASRPMPLPVSSVRVSASTPVDTPVYVGVFSAQSDFTRTLHLSGVKVRAIASTEVTVTPLLCRGSLSVTSEPGAFCAELVDPEGQSMTGGDEIVLAVQAAEPGGVVIDRVRLAYRDGATWGTQEAGSPAAVRILPR